MLNTEQTLKTEHTELLQLLKTVKLKTELT